MNSGKGRSSLIGIVGGYLVYLAWQLYQGRNNPDTSMSPAVMILFIALFALAGAGLFAYACILWKRAKKEEQEERKRGQDENAMK